MLLKLLTALAAVAAGPAGPGERDVAAPSCVGSPSNPHPVVLFHHPVDDSTHYATVSSSSSSSSSDEEAPLRFPSIPLSVSLRSVPAGAMVLLQLDGRHQTNVTHLCMQQVQPPQLAADDDGSRRCHLEAALAMGSLGWHAAAIIVYTAANPGSNHQPAAGNTAGNDRFCFGGSGGRGGVRIVAASVGFQVVLQPATKEKEGKSEAMALEDAAGTRRNSRLSSTSE